jgi:hypothetical protein
MVKQQLKLLKAPVLLQPRLSRRTLTANHDSHP